MTPDITPLEEPCQAAEHWKAATIGSKDSEKTVPACYLEYADGVHVMYWVDGLPYQFDVNMEDLKGKDESK